MGSTSLTDARRYREIIEQGGLSGTHKKAIDWVAPGSRVLELGCSTGYIGEILARDKNCRVWGVEADALAAEEARALGMTVYQGSLEDPTFRASVEGPFDVVIATDVLEHLADPEPVLMHIKDWLGQGGRAIIAVPNIATWTMRVQLMLYGDFEYQESGLLDRTHLHFFTYETLMALVNRQHWRVVDTYLDGYEIPGGNNVLWKWPEAFKSRLEAPAGYGVLGRALSKMGAEGLAVFGRARHWAALRLAARLPNLCVPHVSLLLSAE